MPSTYTPIASSTISGTSTTVVTFTSIPSTYTDLLVVVNGLNVGSADAAMTFNNDSGANYCWTRLFGDGSTTYSGRASAASDIPVSIGYMNDRTNTLVNIMNYSNATTYKTTILRANKSTGYVEAMVDMWKNTSAINRIDITTPSGYFAAGTIFTIYGIKAA
jgi:hypothetical protein